MSGDQRGFPVAAFRQFTVAGHHKHPTLAVVAFRGQGDPHRYRQTMSQRAGVQLNARGFVFHRVAWQVRVGMLIGGEPLDGNKPGLGQHAVIAAHRMAF
ncbi:hypothetical protein D3C76_1719810 [compost metagenome]